MATDADASAPLPPVSSAAHEFRAVNGITLHTVVAGDPSDPLVVLLHGFPEFWYEWYEYVEPLVEAGYRVLVPDQRGYNRSDKPPGVRAYRISTLSRDIDRLVETEGHESAHIVGHDWGAAVAWDLALRHPDVVDRLGIINVPHPTVFEQELRRNPRQLANSWYMLFFQLPRLPEWVVGQNRFDVAVRAMRDSARPGAFTDTDFQRYRRAWSREGARTAMLNWYRAIARHRDRPPREQVQAPTQIIWGEQDDALVPELAPKSLDYCADGHLERFPDATHWVPHEHPDRVTDLVLDHLS